MAQSCFKKLERVPRPLVASLGKNSSHILCLKDQALNELFVIDTGSDYSIVKSNSFEISNYPSEQFLIAANAVKISTPGERTMNLKLSKNCTIKWTFLSAEISFNLIGADFLQQNNLLIDLYNHILINAKAKKKIHLTNKNLAVEKPPVRFLADCKFTHILKEYPDLTRPRNRSIAERVPIEHQIQVDGYPCHACCRPMSAEKLRWLEKEIEKLLDEDVIEVSNSEFASPTPLCLKLQEVTLNIEL